MSLRKCIRKKELGDTAVNLHDINWRYKKKKSLQDFWSNEIVLDNVCKVGYGSLALHLNQGNSIMTIVTYSCWMFFIPSLIYMYSNSLFLLIAHRLEVASIEGKFSVPNWRKALHDCILPLINSQRASLINSHNIFLPEEWRRIICPRLCTDCALDIRVPLIGEIWVRLELNIICFLKQWNMKWLK